MVNKDKAMSIKDTLNEREKTHGGYDDVSRIAQGIKGLLRSGPSWEKMNDQQQEALEMVSSKMARVVSGDHNEKDHMHDTAGYAQLYNKAVEDAEIDGFLSKSQT